MTENDRKILTKACGLVWHEITETNGYYRCSCGASFHGLESLQARRHAEKSTFTTPDDWEMVRVKVVVPNVDNYLEYFQDEYEHAWYAFAERMITSSAATLCQDAVDFIKSRPDLFPWVEKMMKV